MKRFSTRWFSHHLRHNSAAQWFWSHNILYLMTATRESRQRPQTTLPFKIDSREDLEHFQPTERWHNREQLLRQAEEQLAHGCHCVTLVLDGQLAFVDWMRPVTRQATFGYVGQTVIFPPGVSTQFSGYVHPAHRGKGLFHEGMRRILDYLFEHTDTEYAFAAVEHTNPVALKGHLNIGFETVAVLETHRRLGRTTYQGKSLTPTFSLQPEQGVAGTWRIETHHG